MELFCSTLVVTRMARKVMESAFLVFVGFSRLMYARHYVSLVYVKCKKKLKYLYCSSQHCERIFFFGYIVVADNISCNTLNIWIIN